MIHTVRLTTGLFIARQGQSIVQTLGVRKRDKALQLWLSCHTQEEIAGGVGVPQQTMADWMKEFTEKLTSNNSAKWQRFRAAILEGNSGIKLLN